MPVLHYDKAVSCGVEGEAGVVRLSDYLKAERIAIMQGGRKTDALMRLIELSQGDEPVRDYEAFRREVLRRESILSTGIGMGVAVPHVKTAAVQSFFITVGVFTQGIDWDSLDGKPVFMAFLIGGPDDHQQYLQILAKLTLNIRNEERRRAILTAVGPEEIVELFADL